MITFTQNAIAAVKTARSGAAKPAEDPIQDLYMDRAASVAAMKQPFPAVWAASSLIRCERAAPQHHIAVPWWTAPAVDGRPRDRGPGAAQAFGLLELVRGRGSREGARGAEPQWLLPIFAATMPLT